MRHKLMGVWAGGFPQKQAKNLLTVLQSYLLLPQIHADHEVLRCKSSPRWALKVE